MDDGRADGQNKVQPVPPFPEKVPPVWEVSHKPYDDLDVECNRNRELSVVKKPPVDGPRVNCASGLYCQGGESQDDPKPLGQLVVVFEFVPSGSYQAAIDDTEVLVVLSIDIDDQPTRRTSINVWAAPQWSRRLTELRQMHSFAFLS